MQLLKSNTSTKDDTTIASDLTNQGSKNYKKVQFVLAEESWYRCISVFTTVTELAKMTSAMLYTSLTRVLQRVSPAQKGGEGVASSSSVTLIGYGV